MKRYVSAAALSLCLALPALAGAQQTVVVGPEGSTAIFSGSHFFVAVIAGLILAIAFQLVLTTLSVAAGVTAIGPMNEPSHAPKSEPSRGVGATARRLSGAFGAWTLVTASVALFFGSWLGVELSLTASVLAGAVLGLVIWGLFYFVLMTVEASAVASLAGSLFRFATTGLRAVIPAATGIFTRSPERRAADTAHEVASAVREELLRDADLGDLKSALRRYVLRLEKAVDPKRIARELADVLDHTELRAVATHEGPFLDRETIVAHLGREPGMTADKAKQVAAGMEQALESIREEQATDKDRTARVVDTSLRLAGMSAEEAAHYRVRVERYLRETGREELNPEAIKRDLELLLSDPRGGLEALRDRVRHFDRNTVATLLAARGDLSPDEANKVVSWVEQAARTVLDSARGVKERAGTEADAARWEAEGVRSSVLGKVRAYLDGLDDPRLRFDAVRADVQQLLHDPKAGADALIRRLRSLDRGTLVAILASREDFTREEAEHLVDQIEGARDDLLARAEQMRAEVEKRVEAAGREALEAAEETRKTAASAAWWAVGTAVASGVAATLGGVLAVSDRTF